MIIENPAALQFILNEQIYLSKSDIDQLEAPSRVAVVADEPTAAEIPVIQTQAETPAASVTTEMSKLDVPQPVAETSVVTEPEPVIPTSVVSFTYLGKNAKAFLIACYYPETDGMDEKHLAALTNTLQRKELTLDDVAIINIAQYASVTAKQIHAFFKPTRLLILGKQGVLPGWNTLQFNQLLEKNGFKALLTDSFTDMMTDREKAKAFWEQMKQL